MRLEDRAQTKDRESHQVVPPPFHAELRASIGLPVGPWYIAAAPHGAGRVRRRRKRPKLHTLLDVHRASRCPVRGSRPRGVESPGKRPQLLNSPGGGSGDDSDGHYGAHYKNGDQLKWRVDKLCKHFLILLFR